MVQPCVLLRMWSFASPINLPAIAQMKRTISSTLEKLVLLTLAITLPPTSRVANIWSLADNDVLVLLIIMSSIFVAPSEVPCLILHCKDTATLGQNYAHITQTRLNPLFFSPIHTIFFVFD